MHFGCFRKTRTLICIIFPIILLVMTEVVYPSDVPSVKPTAQITLLEQARVEGTTIYLRDIADIETADDELRHRLERLEVGRSAIPGFSRTITVGTIVLRARQARLTEHDIVFHGDPNRIEVYTASQTIPPKIIEDAVAAWYTEQLQIPDDAVLHIDVDSPEVVVGVGEIDFRLIAGKIGWGRNLLTMEVSVNGESAKRVQVSATATIEQYVYVTRRDLSRGEVVDEMAVERQRLRLDRPAFLLEPSTVRTTRSIRSGTPLTWAVVEQVPMVNRGDRVSVEAGRGGVHVQIVGVAQADGWLGDEIMVQNERSGVTFNALVVAPQTVRAVQ